MLWGSWGDLWEQYHKVTFDGETRRIIINPGVTSLSVKTDIYSAWKEWISVYDHAKFVPAMRVIGGDPVGGGLAAGDIYFLVNGWQIVVTGFVTVNGVLYHDDPISPYIINPGAGIISTVSNLVQTSTPIVNIDGISIPTAIDIRQEIDANSTQLADIKAAVEALPSAAITAEAVWNYSLKELSDQLTPEQFWNFMLTSPMAQGSAGEKLKQVLTTGNFLALK